jgi:hypothetical protein
MKNKVKQVHIIKLIRDMLEHLNRLASLFTVLVPRPFPLNVVALAIAVREDILKSLISTTLEAA